MRHNRLFNTVAGLLISITLVFGLAIPIKSLAAQEAALPAAASASPPVELNRVIQGYAGSQVSQGLGLLIPIVSVIIIFGGPVLIVSLLITQHYRSQKRLAEFRRESIGKLIDAGRDVPESLLYFDDLGKDKNPERDLSRGVKNIGLGVGIGVFLAAVSSLQAGTFGLILVSLGCAQLLSWKLTRKNA